MARTEEQTRPAAAAVGARPAPNNGRGEAPPADKPPPSPLRRLILPTLLIVLVISLGLGLMYFQQLDAYVSTDQALVTGTLIQFGPTSPVQVRTVNVEVGDRVDRGQVLATIVGPSGQTQSLRSSLDGIVLARYANPGDTHPAGRPIVSVLDPGELWVQAQIEESQVGRLRPGQTAEVTIEALGRTIQGRVLSVGGASSAALANPTSLPPRTRQQVPVRIAVDPGSAALVYGGQAYVRIFVR